MSELERFEKRKKITKYVMITLSVLFVSVMLVLPLVSIVTSSLKEGLGFYIESVTKSYVLSALKVTLIATVIASYQVFFQRKAGACDTYRYSFFNISGYSRTCVPYDIRKAGVVLSGDKMV